MQSGRTRILYTSIDTYVSNHIQCDNGYALTDPRSRGCLYIFAAGSEQRIDEGEAFNTLSTKTLLWVDDGDTSTSTSSTHTTYTRFHIQWWTIPRIEPPLFIHLQGFSTYPCICTTTS